MADDPRRQVATSAKKPPGSRAEARIAQQHTANYTARKLAEQEDTSPATLYQLALVHALSARAAGDDRSRPLPEREKNAESSSPHYRRVIYSLYNDTPSTTAVVVWQRQQRKPGPDIPPRPATS